MLRKRFLTRAFFGCLILLGIVAGATLFVLPAFNRDADAIQALQRNEIALEDVSVYAIEFSPINGWPFTEREYSQLPSKIVAPDSDKEALLQALAHEVTRGHQYHNHPELLQRGILKLVVSPDDWFYVYFAVHREKRGVFVELNALPRATTNPNGGRTYTSYTLQNTLAKYGRPSGT